MEAENLCGMLRTCRSGLVRSGPNASTVRSLRERPTAVSNILLWGIRRGTHRPSLFAEIGPPGAALRGCYKPGGRGLESCRDLEK